MPQVSDFSAVNACGASESTAQGKSVSPQKGSATAFSSEHVREALKLLEGIA
jgi:hypothetical protein